jgi:alpha-beta hydrolase superfamily lysophospholipase
MTDIDAGTPTSQELTLQTEDLHEIHIRLFAPQGEVRGVIQIIHGLGEHAGRYKRFADAANIRGFAVVAYDQRGHGDHDPENRGYFGARDGWNLLVSDALCVHEFAKEQFPGKPQILMGHSMGSFVAQSFAMHHGSRIDALILSGSTWTGRLEAMAANLLARIECWRVGAHRTSKLLDKLGYSNFNRRFEPARTEYDWLSHDDTEVDRYAEDPRCGGPYTAGAWRDLTGGLYEIGSDLQISRIPTDLPILISGGELDPVGGERKMGKLALHYAQTSHGRLKVKIYPGGRHEMLNEVNRDQVTADWLDWIEQNAAA